MTLTPIAKDIDLARRVALNPSTPPELLEELANNSDAVIRKNVTANPQTLEYSNW